MLTEDFPAFLLLHRNLKEKFINLNRIALDLLHLNIYNKRDYIK